MLATKLANLTEIGYPVPALIARVIFSFVLLSALIFHAIPALLAGLLAFVLTRQLLVWLKRYTLPRNVIRHEFFAAILVGLLSLVCLFAVGYGIAHLLRGESLRDLMLTLAETLRQSKQFLPESISAQLPDSLVELQPLLSETIKKHANTLAGVSTQALHSVLLTIIGWITGILAAARNVTMHNVAEQPVFATTWFRLWQQLGSAFEHVAFAQTKIAAMNAALTSLFLFVLCPLAGWTIPYAKTIVLVTFVFGLLPIIGNLVSNTITCTLALGVSLSAAIAALTFLIVIHKLEYFISARFQGREIGAQAWELLIMLFAFEILFGPAGMVAAPVIYAFFKAELRDMRWLASIPENLTKK